MNPWNVQCPARGYGLMHKHNSECVDGHIAGQCCECGFFPGPQVAEEKRQMVMPPLDVAARLKSLGLHGDEDMEAMEDIRAEHADDDPVEPRMSKSPGPTEREWYEATLPTLTVRQQMRISGYVELARLRGVDREAREATDEVQ